MDIGRAFGAPFKDPQWLPKVGLGGLWGLLGVTVPAVGGAQMDYIRSVASGNETLPDWSDFGGKWVRGFLLYLGFGIYMFPAIILFSISFIPLIIAAATDSGDAAAAAGLGGMCLFGGIATIWTIVVSIFASAGMVNYAMTGRFGAMFAFSDIMARIRSGTGYFMAWGMSLVISFAAGMVVSILSATGIGSILAPWAYFPAYMMSAHIFGQWAAVAYGGMAPAAAPVQYATPPTAPAPPAPPVSPAPPAPPVAPVAPVPPAPPVAPVAPIPPAPPQATPPAPVQPPAPPAPAAPPEAAPPAPPVAPAPDAAPPAPPAPPAAPEE